MNAQSIFFQLPNLKKKLFGRSKWLLPTSPGDKNAQSRSSVALHAVTHSMRQRLQNVIKSKQNRKKKQRGKGKLVTEIMNTCTRESNKRLLEIS